MFTYDVAGQALERLIPVIMEAFTDERHADYLNVNVPVSKQDAGDAPLREKSMRLTSPDKYYDTKVQREENSIRFQNDYGPQSHWIEKGRSAKGIPSPSSGSTQAAIRDGDVAVTPLQVPYQPLECDVTRLAVDLREE